MCLWKRTSNYKRVCNYESFASFHFEIILKIKLLGVKKATPSVCVYLELGRITQQS